MSNVMRSVMALALALAVLVPTGTAQAGWKYSAWVNGFGSGGIEYTLFCRDGTVIGPVTSNTSPGADACPDGSNSISWSWGAFWNLNVRPVSRKESVSTTCDPNTQGQLVSGGTSFQLSGNVALGDDIQGTIAVLKVPASRIPAGPPLGLNDLLAQGIVTSSEVAFRRDYSAATTETLNQTIPLGGTFTDNGVIIYQHFTAATGVPALGTTGMLVLGTSVLAVGAVLMLRRRG